ncbi:30S ribosomal protein S4e [Candidatus Woesearchaeota archaeon]|nr:30S ribosomal protein S4e [Candidatus Woesearchaeota archaeon]
MGSRIEKHLSRLAMPRTWKIKRKDKKWVTRPLPGPHPFKLGLPINLLIRNILKYTRTAKETRYILNNQEIFVDHVRRKNHRFIVGLMDVISMPKIKENFRILFDKKGKIIAFPIDNKESKIKPCKVKGKKVLKKGKIQLNLFDGKNIILSKEKSISVGDTVLIELPSQKIKDSFKLDKKAFIYLTGGKHIGETGTVEDIKDNLIIYKRGKKKFETLKKYAFVIGKEKPSIKLPE